MMMIVNDKECYVCYISKLSASSPPREILPGHPVILDNVPYKEQEAIRGRIFRTVVPIDAYASIKASRCATTQWGYLDSLQSSFEIGWKNSKNISIPNFNDFFKKACLGVSLTLNNVDGAIKIGTSVPYFKFVHEYLIIEPATIVIPYKKCTLGKTFSWVNEDRIDDKDSLILRDIQSGQCYTYNHKEYYLSPAYLSFTEAEKDIKSFISFVTKPIPPLTDATISRVRPVTYTCELRAQFYSEITFYFDFSLDANDPVARSSEVLDSVKQQFLNMGLVNVSTAFTRDLQLEYNSSGILVKKKYGAFVTIGFPTA